MVARCSRGQLRGRARRGRSAAAPVSGARAAKASTSERSRHAGGRSVASRSRKGLGVGTDPKRRGIGGPAVDDALRASSASSLPQGWSWSVPDAAWMRLQLVRGSTGVDRLRTRRAVRAPCRPAPRCPRVGPHVAPTAARVAPAEASHSGSRWFSRPMPSPLLLVSRRPAGSERAAGTGQRARYPGSFRRGRQATTTTCRKLGACAWTTSAPAAPPAQLGNSLATPSVTTQANARI